MNQTINLLSSLDLRTFDAQVHDICLQFELTEEEKNVENEK